MKEGGRKKYRRKNERKKERIGMKKEIGEAR